MGELKKLSKKCFDWLNEKPRTQWSRSAFRSICKSDMFVNNHSEATDRAAGCERPVKTRTKNTNKTLAGNNNGANEASRSETLGNQNAGNEAGRSENVGNQTAGNEAGRSQNVGNQTAGNEAGRSETVVDNQSSGTAKNVPTRTDNVGSQGDILSKKPRQYKKNTPLGIQPQRVNSKGKGTTTTLANIEATRRQMQAKLRENPVWKM
ncbi:hypothetical protein POM88_005081 [Heracleum sosnowskyi]|uniref:Uncharacterized protein n=1 Tax=Heracleum sosnowskyi TaxID=360622 RepID=A0AAD8JMU5_9APIA|nr:hypothetical protein POM88_005081 [Heracleum sosnowskyi]